jgi:CheY-like chemotaxis protein
MLNPLVLLVDDDPETLAVLANALEREGIRVRTASSVFRALEALHDGSPKPAVIITDLMMPQTSGWDLLKHLRAEPALHSLPVIVITGVEIGEAEGLADLVLQKPFSPVQLAEAVRSLLLSRSEAP